MGGNVPFSMGAQECWLPLQNIHEVLTTYYPEHNGVAHNGGDHDEEEEDGPDGLVQCQGTVRINSAAIKL